MPASRRSIRTARSCSIRSAPRAGRCSASWSCRSACPGSSRCCGSTSASRSTGAIVGEFIASQHGLGRAILYAGQTYDIALVWVAVLVLSTLAIVMYASGVVARKRAAQRRAAIVRSRTLSEQEDVMNRRKFLHRPRPWRDCRPHARGAAVHRARRHQGVAGRRAGALHRLSADVHRDGQQLFRRGRHRREDRHHRDRLRPHQRGALRPGLRLHRRSRAQCLRQGQGRRTARRRALRRPRQRLSLRGQGPGAARTGTWPAYVKGKTIAVGPYRRHAELDHALSAREVETRRQDAT